ncbi:MAG: (5-formylfuran-3-yl)methyl phosphate synthase [Methylococcaceae bacterium]|nr:(5-formylfuran-3-yl)methyl phosphate synthase [Methylococcaceae bacterium]
MTGMLASVNSLEEALTVAGAEVDIIDLKEPRAGALGALQVTLVKEIVLALKGRCPVSATVGDLPMQPELVYSAAQVMADTGVDYVKIGIFPNGEITGVLEMLKTIALDKNLIAVLFADSRPDFQLIDSIKSANFCGVMLDTFDKSKGSLTSVMTLSEISAFVRYAKSHQLLCGLAGSLSADDIPLLLPVESDYLGFRGALCEKHNRVERLSIHEVQRIRKQIP